MLRETDGYAVLSHISHKVHSHNIISNGRPIRKQSQKQNTKNQNTKNNEEVV